MIKFFRKIRQNRLMENKTGKYLKYALGEILLVVIGILIALSINNWNENNKGKKEASFQLSKLKDNLNLDKAQIKESISFDSIYIDNLIFCIKVLSNEIETPKEEFLDRFRSMSVTMTFNPTRGTFEGLISSGNIKLINNQYLLDSLFLYYNANEHNAWDSSLKDYSRNVFMPYLLSFDHISNDLNDISNDINENEGTDFTQFDISKFSVPRKTIDDYKNNLFVLNGLRLKIQLFEGQKRAYIELNKIIDALINSIDVELKK